jgi:hypothetical protein
VQGFAVAALASPVATLFATISAQALTQATPWQDRSVAGFMVGAVLSLSGVTSGILVLVFHGMAIGATRRALIAHADKAS